MLFVETIARRLMPQWNENTNLSIACISTTNPVYLVFNETATHPELVVRVADTDEVCKAHKVTEQLYSKVGDLVPEPIAITRFKKHDYAVQKGIKGRPWFQLASSITSPSHWNALRERSITALNQLHQGSSEVDGWVSECSPGNELRNSLRQCLAAGTPMAESLVQQVETMSKKLDTMGTLSTFRQHGDFCLNNLIIDNDTIHIIDFEDFGMTSMPLFDEFSLALSMYLQAPKNINTSLLNELEYCIREGAAYFGIETELLPAFFLHHLLLRLGEWSLGKRRKNYREWLMATLESFVLEPDRFFCQHSNC